MAFSAVTERGSGFEKVSDTSFGISPSAALTVGKIVYLLAVTDNTPTTDGASTDHTSVADTDGHTWTKVYERTNATGAAADGATASLWWTKVTTEIGTGDTVTLTIGTARTAKLLGLFEVTVGAGNTVALAAGGSTFQETDLSNVPALTLSGLASKEYLFLGIAGSENTAFTWTEDADYTNVYAAEGIGTTGGGGATNVAARIGYRIATLTGDTFQPAGLLASEHTMAFLAFEEVSGASTQNLTGTLFTKAPTFFTGVVTSVRNLAGVLFTKAPTFFTGVVTARRTLSGVLFSKAPTFFTGTVTAGTVTLTGTLFTKAPTFPTGAVSLAAAPQTLNGVLFTKAPTFLQGAVTATYALTGTLFVKAPTFFTGTVTAGAITLTGTLFVKAPTFFTGTVTPGVVTLTGVLFQKAPTFPIGAVSATVTLNGVLFQKAPTFPTGTIGQAGTLFGNLFQKAPTFFTGTITRAAPSFWITNPAGYTPNPVAFVRVGGAGPSPWGTQLSGRRFEKAPTFPVGTVT